ncbi:MAG: fimbrial biogenesis outer membrane usher protein [Proteobacteria bacterium]|nr:fimbrial biogenesis outer membrane usher protein [Pseudomonadota bacterium]
MLVVLSALDLLLLPPAWLIRPLPLGPHGALAQAATQEEIFRRVFGKPSAPAAERTVSVPYYLDGRFMGEVRVVISPDPAELRIDAVPLLAEVGRVLQEEPLAALESAVDPKGYLPFRDLRRQGLDAVFDELALVLRITIPASLRRTLQLRLRRVGPPPEARTALAPAPVSAFVNLRSAVAERHTARTGVRTGRQPVRADLDGAFNLQGWVAEGVANYTEDAARPWQRGDFRLVHDDIGRMWRYSAGDLSYPRVGFQSFVPMGGLTLAKNFSLQPYRVTQPTGEAEFRLDRTAKAEIYVNDRLVSTQRLPAGSYNVRDFPFASGVNDVRVKLTDDVGREEVLHFPYVFESALLAPGEDEFAYNVGLPSQTAGGLRKYEHAFPTFSLFHRAGLSEIATLGANLQGSGDQQMAGVEATVAGVLGTVRTDLAASRTDAAGPDLAARLQYRYSDPRPTNPWRRTWSFSTTYQGRDFASLGRLAPTNPVALNFAAGYSQKWFWDLSVGLGADYQVGRVSRRNTNGANLYFTRSFRDGITSTLRFERRVDTEGVISGTALFTVNIPLYEGRQSVLLTRETYPATSRLDWRYTPFDQVGEVAASASLERGPETQDLSGEVLYTGTRGRLALDHDVSRPRHFDPGDATERTSTLRADGAIVFAGGRVGLGRLVSNSFAIIAPHPNLEGQPIEVNPRDHAYLARIDRLGPAVLPELSPYRVTHVMIDAPDLPVGYELGEQSFHLLPTYKSGTMIQVGTEARVFLVGALKGEDGRPVGLQAGEIVFLDRPDHPPILMFSNRVGKFVAEGLLPGRYHLRLYAHPEAPIPFVIPEGTEGRYDAGALVLRTAEGAAPVPAPAAPGPRAPEPRPRE